MKAWLTTLHRTVLIFSALLAATPVVASEYYQVPGRTSTASQILPSGEFEFAVPIEVPTGTAGVAPSVELKYSNKGADGLLGKGWSMTGMGAVTRCAANTRLDQRLSGVEFGPTARYCLNGNRLVLVAGDYGVKGSEYRTEINANQAIFIEDSNQDGPLYFKVVNPDGRSFYYGASDDSRVELQQRSIVYFWALSKVEDHLGNYISFEYYEHNESGRFKPFKIHYTGNEQQNLAPYNTIEFVYGPRPDPIHSCVNGALVQTAERLKEVVVNKFVPSDQSGAEGALNTFRRYFLSYGNESLGEFKTVSNSICDIGTPDQNAQISPYQEVLNSQFSATSSHVERLERYENVQELLAAQHTEPDHIDLSELIESYAAKAGDRSSGAYGDLLDNFGNVEAELNNLANQAQNEFLGLSFDDQQAYLDDLRDEITRLAADVDAGRSAAEGELMAKRAILDNTKALVESQLTELLKQQMVKANRVIYVPINSPYKKRLMQQLNDDLKIKYRAAALAADECLAFTLAAESGESQEILDQLPCNKANIDDAFNAFIHYGEGAATYHSLESALNELLEPQVRDGIALQSLVKRSETNHYYHLLVAGQVVSLYEAFAQRLRRDTLRQFDTEIASIDAKIKTYNPDLETEEFVGEEILIGERITQEELALRDARFKLNLLESGKTAQVFTNEYVAELQNTLTHFQAGATQSNIRSAADTRTKISTVLNTLRVIQDQSFADTLVNYQGILNGLLHGDGAILAQKGDGQANTVLGESRVVAIQECGVKDVCFEPVVFSWTEETIGWESLASNDTVPDHLISYDKVRAGFEGLSIDAGELSGGDQNGDGSDGPPPSLTPEQVSLARELAEAGQLIDINADGFDDWVISYRREDGSEFKGTWLNNQSGWTFSETYTLPVLASTAGNVPLGQFIDLNGDGQVDWLGSAVLANGEVIKSSLLNTVNGWIAAPEFELPTRITQIDATGHTVLGQFFETADGDLSWASGGTSASFRKSWQLGLEGWSDVDGAPFATENSSINGASGQATDINGDGLNEWVEYAEVDGVKSLKVWQQQVDGWVENTDFSIANVHSFDHGQFIDLNNDGRKDWLVSTVSETGSPVTQILLQSAVGWQAASFPAPQSLQDADGHAVAYLLDLNGDGTVEWVKGLKSGDGQTTIQTQQLDGTSWVSQAQLELPHEIVEYLDSGDYNELGQFGNLTGNTSPDWLNLTQIWTEGNVANNNTALSPDSGSWIATDGYRLPVLEDRWIKRVSDILAALRAGESVLESDQNLIAAAENMGSSGSGSSTTSVNLEVAVPSDDANGVKTGSLIDVDGDGRLDWVKSVRFSVGVEQKVVWLRSESGWVRSETFLPPLPLVDFTKRALTQLLDLDSDGLPDFLRSFQTASGSVETEFWRNNGENWEHIPAFSLPRALFTQLNDHTFQSALLLDLDRDGRLDLLSDGSDGKPAGAWLHTLSGFSATVSFAPTFGFTEVADEKRVASGQFVDLNQDGLIDWVKYSAANDEVYINNGSGWAIDTDYQLPISIRNSVGEQTAVFADLNKDGYKDLAMSYRPIGEVEQRNTWLNTGRGWRPDLDIDYHLPAALFLQERGQVAHLLDVNSDGFIDFLQSIDGGTEITNNRVLWLGSKSGFSLHSQNEAIPTLLHRVENLKLYTDFVVTDADGDLEADFVRASESDVAGAELYHGLYSVAGSINASFDGAKLARVDYQKGHQPFTVFQADERASYPLLSGTGPGVIVSGYRSMLADSLDQQSNDGLISDVAYTYSGYTYDLSRAHAVGFQYAESMDWIGERVSISEFEQTFPHYGRQKSSRVSQLWGGIISRTEYDHVAKTHASMGDKVLYSYLANTEQTNYTENGDLLNTISTEYLNPHDKYFIPRETHQTLNENGVEHHTLTINDVAPDEAKWLLAQSLSTQVQTWNTNNPTPLTITTTRGYNPNGLKNFETVAGNRTNYAHDAFGNVTERQRGVGSGLVVRKEHFTFDALGRFLITQENAAGEITHWSYEDVFDSPSDITVNDRTHSHYEYDGFGRKTREIIDGEIIYPFDIKYCSDVTSSDNILGCPANAVHLTAKFSNEEKGSAAQTIYYDQLGREVRKATASAESLVYIDTQYTINGQVQSRTVPYAPGPDVEIQKVEFGYDSFGRQTYLIEPGNRIRIWEYDGRAVTEYDPNGNKTTTVSTHFGAPSKVIDAYDAETVYTYNSFGQLVETKDAAGNTTSITYDAWGNKRVVIDPNHGVTTFTHNVFGQVTTKTDALGNRQEYVYDNWGRLHQRIDTGVDTQGGAVEPVVATWDYYNLNEAKQAYADYIDELTEREVPQEQIDEINELSYLNSDAKVNLVKRVSDTNGYVAETVYDYRVRPVENKVKLPGSDAFKSLKTDYLGESQLPATVFYPNKFSVGYEYDEFGYLTEAKNAGLNTRDHYFGLIEQAEHLQEVVAKKAWDIADDIKDGELKDKQADYRRHLRTAGRVEDKAIEAAQRIDHFQPQVYDDHHAIEHLRKDLLQITSQTERSDRDNLLNGLYGQYGVDGAATSSGAVHPSLRTREDAGCSAPRHYTFHTPAYTTYDYQPGEGEGITREVPIKQWDAESRSYLIIGYETKNIPPEPVKTNPQDFPAKTITRYLPGLCDTPLWQIQETKLHRKKERQLVDHIVGLMRLLRDRKQDNEATIANAVQTFEKEAENARKLYQKANNWFADNAQPLVDQISTLYTIGNEAHGKGYEIFVKAGRVYQFYEVEREISFWKVEESDEINRIVQARYGNGVVNSKEYDPITGVLRNISARADNNEFNYQNEDYWYDPAGNLAFKSHHAMGTTEGYKYDKLNRLTKASYTFYGEATDDDGNNVSSKVSQDFTYDAIGNIQTKTGVGDYSYHPQKPHAVVSAGNRAYTYDDIGRMRTGDGATFDYTSFSKPKRIAENSGDFAEFAYGPDHNRYYQKRVTGEDVKETFYFFKGLYEETVDNGETVQQASIAVRGKNIAVIEGYNKVFAAADELPTLLSETDVAEELQQDLSNDDNPFTSYFTALDGFLKAQELVANTTDEDIVYVSQLEGCQTEEDLEPPQEGEEPSDEEEDQEPEEEPKRLRCLTPEQVEQVTEIAASSLINIRYYHYDALDSIKLVTNADGDMEGINYYDAFGNPMLRPEVETGDDSEAEAAFGGHEAILGMDLVHMNGRIYDPVIGRFVSADPFVPAIYNPQSLNRYSYVYNNPLRYTDPSGYKPIVATQHDRNAYIFDSLAQFEIETYFPDRSDFAELLALKRNNPYLFEKRLEQSGVSIQQFQSILGYQQSANSSRRAARQIRKAERQAKYMTIAAVVITIVTSGAGSEFLFGIEASTTTLAYAKVGLTAFSQLAITGDLDVQSTLLSLVSIDFGNLLTDFLGAQGASFAEFLRSDIGQAVVSGVSRGVLRGFSSHLAGGEFEHGFAAGFSEALLEKYLPTRGFESFLGDIVRSGIIEGLVAEISNEVGSDGEQLGFAGGFQRGSLFALGTKLGESLIGDDGLKVCRQTGCNLSSFGSALNLIANGADGLQILNALVESGLTIYGVNAVILKQTQARIVNAQNRLVNTNYLVDHNNDGIPDGHIFWTWGENGEFVRVFLPDGRIIDHFTVISSQTPGDPTYSGAPDRYTLNCFSDVCSDFNEGLAELFVSLSEEDRAHLYGFVDELKVKLDSLDKEAFTALLNQVAGDLEKDKAFVDGSDSQILAILGLKVKDAQELAVWLNQEKDDYLLAVAEGRDTDVGRHYANATLAVIAAIVGSKLPTRRRGDGDGNGNGGVCSFHGDTLVQTSEGMLPIRDMNTSMSVWSRDPANGDMGWKAVEAQYSNPYEETVSVTIRDVESGAEQAIVSNRIHPYFVQTSRTVANSSEGHIYSGPLENGYWVDAAELRKGDRLLNSDGSWAEVMAVTVKVESLKAYNLTVSDFHTYFVAANDDAEPVWVHNNCNNGKGVLSKADFESKFNGKFDSKSEMDEGYFQYRLASGAKSEIVLGRLPDTAAGSELGMTRLKSDAWSENINDAFVQGGIDKRKPFYLGSSPDISNYRSAWNSLEANRGDFPKTIFLREMKQLRDAGYRLDGDYMLPPD